jgi:hypothetical protein
MRTARIVVTEVNAEDSLRARSGCALPRRDPESAFADHLALSSWREVGCA